MRTHHGGRAHTTITPSAVDERGSVKRRPGLGPGATRLRSVRAHAWAELGLRDVGTIKIFFSRTTLSFVFLLCNPLARRGSLTDATRSARCATVLFVVEPSYNLTTLNVGKLGDRHCSHCGALLFDKVTAKTSLHLPACSSGGVASTVKQPTDHGSVQHAYVGCSIYRYRL